MGVLEAAAATAALSSLYGTYQQHQSGKRNERTTNKRNAMAEGYILPRLDRGPGSAETGLESFLAGLQPLREIGVGQGFNTGQDALMQMLRADPLTKTDAVLGGIMETGDPFDTSNVFKTLAVVDNHNREAGLADLRAGAGGLGQRFGSAMMRGEEKLVGEMDENTAARNAQIAMQAYEAAQARRLQAAGLQTGREQFNRTFGSNVAQTLANLGLAEADVGFKNQGAQLSREQAVMQGLLGLGGMQSNRDQSTAALLSLLLGAPLPAANNAIGSGGMDIAQLLLMLSNQGGGKTSTRGATIANNGTYGRGHRPGG